MGGLRAILSVWVGRYLGLSSRALHHACMLLLLHISLLW